LAIKGKSRKRSRAKAPALPPRPAIGSRKTPLPLRRDVKRAVVIVLAVLAFLGGLRVWQNVSRSDALREYDRKLTTAQNQFIGHFSPGVPTNVDQNVQAFTSGQLGATMFIALANQWETDFRASADAVGKLKTPNDVIADGQFLIQQSITSYVEVARLWNLAGQLRQIADAEKDKKKKSALNDRVQVLMIEADGLRKQHADLLYQQGAKKITDLNVEYGLQKAPSSSSTPSQ